MSKKTLEEIYDRYEDMEFLTATGLDDAVIGVDAATYRIIYSSKKCIDILAKQMEITKKDLEPYEIEEGKTIRDKKYEIAREFFDYNVISAYVGEQTPIFMDDDF